MTLAYYNENDPKAAAWLRELMWEGLIATGDVDERSIEDVLPRELAGYTQCHFFAGIGGWSYALRLAGWPDDKPVWTGSCPCQTHSTAAHGKNIERDWWPVWRELIAAAAPGVIFGEQVANARWWADQVADDLEALDYAFGATVLPAFSVGQDHTRRRFYFVGNANVRRQPASGVHAKTQELPWDGSLARSVCTSDGFPRRVAIRGFGNAIVPQVAAAFIEAYMTV